MVNGVTSQSSASFDLPNETVDGGLTPIFRDEDFVRASINKNVDRAKSAFSYHEGEHLEDATIRNARSWPFTGCTESE